MFVLVINMLASTLQAISHIKDAQYVYQTMREDFERRHVHNSKGYPVEMRNGFTEMWNLTALIARCEKDKWAMVEITGASRSGQDEKQIIVNCPCLANYMIHTIQKFDWKNEDGTVTKVEQIPIDSRERLEESWINIMQQGEFTVDECREAQIE